MKEGEYMGLYLDSGYLNQKWIEDQANKNGISFIFELGARQVGKTYGSLQLALERKTPFILMRRTKDEMEYICNNVNNPFTAITNQIEVKKDSKYTGSIYRLEENSDPVFTGSLMALSTVAKIRGFNGSLYTDLIYDECIPENHVIKIKDEGDAFVNAIITISGNRELEGKKPLRCWMLSNSNRSDAPILQALGICDKVEEMTKTGKELSILPDRSLMIVKPKSEKIIDQRRKIAIFRAAGTNSKVAKMALDNEFAYDDNSDVIKINLSGFKPLFNYNGIYVYKSNKAVHVSEVSRGSAPEIYAATDQDAIIIRRKYGQFLRSAYFSKILTFDNQRVKHTILDIIY